MLFGSSTRFQCREQAAVRRPKEAGRFEKAGCLGPKHPGSAFLVWGKQTVTLRVQRLRPLRSCGQMTVELALCIPVVLALVGVALNVLGYMNVCAQFDRVAADAVRSQASSPGYGEEGSALAASRVREVIVTAMQSGTGSRFACEVRVTGTPVGLDFGSSGEGVARGNGGISFSLLSRLERYDCMVIYHPWPFSALSFLHFVELAHTRSYTVDPFRPGVLL